jgi:hypothetical protein
MGVTVQPIGVEKYFLGSCTQAESVGDAVYIYGDAQGGVHPVRKVVLTDSAKMPAAGLIVRKSGTTCVVQRGGPAIGVYSGLTPNLALYVDDSARLSHTPPSQPQSGIKHRQRLGFALASNVVDIIRSETIVLQGS